MNKNQKEYILVPCIGGLMWAFYNLYWILTYPPFSNWTIQAGYIFVIDFVFAYLIIAMSHLFADMILGGKK